MTMTVAQKQESLTEQDRAHLESINLADPDFWLRSDVEESLDLMRRHRPISWHQHHESGRGMWAIVRYDDIVDLTRNHDIFINSQGIRAHHDPGSGVVRPGTNVMIEMDPPEQTRNRKYVSPNFTPRAVRKMEDLVRDRARKIINNLPETGEIEFVSEVAARLPMEVICDLVGVDPEDRSMLLDLSNKTLGDQDPEYGVTPEEGAQATRKLRQYGLELAHKRRQNPGDDLLSNIASAQLDGRELPDEELEGMFALLVAAGNETTRTAISHGMLALTQFPDQREKWMKDPVGLERLAAEEVIRWATPLRHMGRVVKEDTVFRGIHMRAGDKVAMFYASANRDPEAIEDPYQFDITRDPNPNASFGSGGAHFCLGANLARREVWVVFQELFARFPNAHAVGEPERLRSIQINGIKSMKVKLA